MDERICRREGLSIDKESRMEINGGEQACSNSVTVQAGDETAEVPTVLAAFA